MATMSGARLLARALRRAGAERIFSLSGNQILPIYDACLDVGIAITDTRHESAAAHMADGWARLRDAPGICLVTAGPGHTNAITGVANAMAAEVPLLWLSGAAERATAGKGGFQEIDQLSLAAPVCKAAWLPERAEDIPLLVARAWRIMLEGRPGPVHLSLPSDVLSEAGADTSDELPASAFQPAPRFPDPALVDQTIALLAQAERPLILASPSVARGTAGEQLQTLGERTRIPWLPLESARGLADPVLNGLGAAVAQADAVLLLAPQDFVIRFARPETFAPGATIIQVAPEPAELGRNAPISLGLAGDVASVLAQLAEAAAEHRWQNQKWRDELANLRREQRAGLEPFSRSDETPIHPLRVAAELAELLPPGATLVEDGGEFGQWMRWGLAESEVTTLLHGKLGAIGGAIPLAIGAAIARPESPTIVILGDGTFGFHGMEFDSAVRHGVPIVAIAGNDAAWAAERHRQVALYGEARVVASDLLPTRYDEVVRALGGHGELVERPEQLRPALERALASGCPACLNVMIQSVPSPAALP